jgi:hypothetical protein
MPFESGFAVSSLDLILGGSFFDAQDVVRLDSGRLVELEVVDVCRHD